MTESPRVSSSLTTQSRYSTSFYIAKDLDQFHHSHRTHVGPTSLPVNAEPNVGPAVTLVMIQT